MSHPQKFCTSKISQYMVTKSFAATTKWLVINSSMFYPLKYLKWYFSKISTAMHIRMCVDGQFSKVGSQFISLIMMYCGIICQYSCTCIIPSLVMGCGYCVYTSHGGAVCY